MISFICALPLVASLFSSCDSERSLAVGYVEGEYVLLAPVETARVTELNVHRGDRVSAGDVVVRLETEDARIAADQAAAVVQQAAAELENLRLGRRPEEIAVIAASLRSAQVQAQDAKKEWQRLQGMAEYQLVSASALDQALTLRETTAARVQELEADLAVARLPARANEIAAAEGRLQQAQKALDNARWRLQQRNLKTPADAVVTEIILHPGEMASPAAPVLSLLPKGATKLVFYIPEPSLSAISLGMPLRVQCEGCGDNTTASISFIATEPEFTPPVIYSVERRQKLVYQVEARPDAPADRLTPGQIVDVFLQNNPP